MNDASVWQCICAWVIAVTTAHCTSKHPVFFRCRQSDREAMTVLTLIPVRRSCLSPEHNKVSDMRGWGLLGNRKKRGTRFWKYVAFVWLTLTNWSSGYTGTTQQIKLLINFTPVSNSTWTNETCPYIMSIPRAVIEVYAKNKYSGSVCHVFCSHFLSYLNSNYWLNKIL